MSPVELTAEPWQLGFQDAARPLVCEVDPSFTSLLRLPPYVSNSVLHTGEIKEEFVRIRENSRDCFEVRSLP
jgi:hypothetical protein